MVVKATTKYEKYAKLTAGRTRYLEAGTGPPLIMLHGMGAGTSANSFDFVLEPLAEHFHVYAMDMLGFGLGDRTIVDGPSFSLIIDLFFVSAKSEENPYWARNNWCCIMIRQFIQLGI